MFTNLGIFVIIRTWCWLVHCVEICSLVKNKIFIHFLVRSFSRVFSPCCLRWVLVDCVVLICRFGNGRGLFPFVVMCYVVLVGGLCLVILWMCIVYCCGVCRWYWVACSCCHQFCHLFCLVGEGRWLACQMCPQSSLFLQVACIPIGAFSGISSCSTSLPSSPLTSGTSCLQTRAWGRSRECTGSWWGLVEFGSTSSGLGSWQEIFVGIFAEWRWSGREWSLFVFRM
jgi:hypothetical protein